MARRPSDRLFTIIAGEPILTAEGLSLLVDVPVTEIEAEAQRQGVRPEQMELPKAWDLRGRDIAARLRLHGVRGDVRAALDFLVSERDQRERDATVPRPG